VIRHSEWERRFSQSLDVAGDQAGGGEGDDTVLSEPTATAQRLDRRLARIGTKNEFVCRRAEASGNPLQLVGRVIQRREMAQRADIPERPAEILRHAANRLIARIPCCVPALTRRIHYVAAGCPCN